MANRLASDASPYGAPGRNRTCDTRFGKRRRLRRCASCAASVPGDRSSTRPAAVSDETATTATSVSSGHR